eukprot:353808-Chlamydomonas_euryale.AAC.4
MAGSYAFDEKRDCLWVGGGGGVAVQVRAPGKARGTPKCETEGYERGGACKTGRVRTPACSKRFS